MEMHDQTKHPCEVSRENPLSRGAGSKSHLGISFAPQLLQMYASGVLGKPQEEQAGVPAGGIGVCTSAGCSSATVEFCVRTSEWSLGQNKCIRISGNQLKTNVLDFLDWLQ